MAVLRDGLRGSFLNSSAVEKKTQVSCGVRVARMCALSAGDHVPLISSQHSPILFLLLKNSPEPQERQRRRRRTGSKSGGERVDAVCDDQACNRRFSSPFSLKEVYPRLARALALLSSSSSWRSPRVSYRRCRTATWAGL